MVKTLKIGQSAAKLLNLLKNRHVEGSTTIMGGGAKALLRYSLIPRAFFACSILDRAE